MSVSKNRRKNGKTKKYNPEKKAQQILAQFKANVPDPQVQTQVEGGNVTISPPPMLAQGPEWIQLGAKFYVSQYYIERALCL